MTVSPSSGQGCVAICRPREAFKAFMSANNSHLSALDQSSRTSRRQIPQTTCNSSACDRRLSHDPQTSRRHEHTIQTSMARASDGRRPERRGSPLALTTAESSTAQAETTISNQHSVGRCRRQHQERRNSPAPDLSPSSSAASPRASPHAASIAGSRAGGAGSRPACRRLSARSEARPSDGRDGHRYVSSAGWRRHPRPGQSTRRGPQGR